MVKHLLTSHHVSVGIELVPIIDSLIDVIDLHDVLDW